MLLSSTKGLVLVPPSIGAPSTGTPSTGAPSTGAPSAGPLYCCIQNTFVLWYVFAKVPLRPAYILHDASSTGAPSTNAPSSGTPNSGTP